MTEFVALAFENMDPANAVILLLMWGHIKRRLDRLSADHATAREQIERVRRRVDAEHPEAVA